MHRLLVVAHGTASAAGSATTSRLVAAVAAARPAVPVSLCFLDVAAPRLPDALDDTPTVVVPLLLSTGYHVQSDIPAAVAGRPATRVARHLGPHPLLTDALLDRLPASAGTTALVAAGSTRPEAAAELAAAADLLAARLGRPGRTAHPRRRAAGLARGAAGPASGSPPTCSPKASSSRRCARPPTGIAEVADPLGVHPKLVELIWTRYDEAQT